MHLGKSSSPEIWIVKCLDSGNQLTWRVNARKQASKYWLERERDKLWSSYPKSCRNIQVYNQCKLNINSKPEGQEFPLEGRKKRESKSRK